MANAFEIFFTTTPTQITAHLNSSTSEAVTLLQTKVPSCSVHFKFEYVTSLDIIKTFKSLNIKKTNDLWGISVKLITNIIDAISPYLAFIFNTCVDSGSFPDLMKYSKLIPLFKSGNKSDPSNYRPISILPSLSKIFEKIILCQLLAHFNFNKIFHTEQYGFTKGRSTSDAGVALLKHIYDAWENSQNAIGVFCDLSKAFDCVVHDTLLHKLNYYGIKGTDLALIASYLRNRIQQVAINGTKSSGSVLQMGVPQGSILGPFLFLIYINDLPFYVKGICDIVLFADDTSLIFKVDRKNGKYDDVNNALSLVQNWFNSNNLVLNAKKTKCIEFSLPNVSKHNYNITLNNEILNITDSTVFLGITLDSKLQWKTHLSSLAGRLSSAVYAVRKIRQLTDIDTARLVYFSYFHSVMSYGILLWGNATDIETIFILQKRAIRSIYNLGARDSLRELFKKIDILTVASQYVYVNIMYIYQNSNRFAKNIDKNGINTRNKNKLVTPSFRLHKVNMSFLGLGIRIYNKIPQKILQLPLSKFKTYVKKTLINKAYYTVKDYMNDVNAWT
ncbi:reverse transcriptase family protein [Listeria welshimeri]|nr:reverse transcriptase family protein [Listeria welshimeri]